MSAPVKPNTRAALERLGRDVVGLVAQYPQYPSDKDHYRLGRSIEAALAAGVKAAIPGRQRDKQIAPDLKKAGHNFRRQVRSELRAARVRRRLEESDLS